MEKFIIHNGENIIVEDCAELKTENQTVTLIPEKTNVTIDDENTVIFKPINKQSNGYIHLIEDAEYTVDFFDIDDNVIYLFGYNDISFSSSDFINKNTKLRITECDNSEEENHEYNETDFVIDDNVNIKFSKTISYIENEYSSLLNICDNNINLITEKRKQKSIIDKEIDELENNILKNRSLIQDFQLMLNELKP